MHPEVSKREFQKFLRRHGVHVDSQHNQRQPSSAAPRTSQGPNTSQARRLSSRTQRVVSPDQADGRLSRQRTYHQPATHHPSSLVRHSSSYHPATSSRPQPQAPTPPPTQARSATPAGPSTSRYPCLYCDRLFSNPHNRTMHVETQHTRELQLTCDQCGLPFTRKSSLKKHKQTAHEQNTRRYPCDLCTQTFSTKSNLAVHKRRKHVLNPPTHTCTQCALQFLTKGSLTRHMRLTHTRT